MQLADGGRTRQRLNYSAHMPVDVPASPRGLTLLLSWQRVCFTVALSLALGLLHGLHWKSSLLTLLLRTVSIGLVGMLAFGLFELWPKRLPKWLARWVLQVLAVALAMPVTTYLFYVLTTPAGASPFWEVQDRLGGFLILTVTGLLIAPWAALGALVRQKEALARHQALAFELERSTYERQALDARLRLLQAQVAPHFLFNTLANVQALVDTGSPQAAAVLRSLIAYLRAAVPRLDEAQTTLGRELDLVRAYLELMHMRMPDRLQFDLHVDESALALRCPPLTLLTLVENAVRHGIDPNEEGGRIDIVVHRDCDRCQVRVSDTGMGLQRGNAGLGTGLATLRERLEMAFGGNVRLRVAEQAPHGVIAELDFPALEARP